MHKIFTVITLLLLSVNVQAASVVKQSDKLLLASYVDYSQIIFADENKEDKEEEEDEEPDCE